MKMYRPAKHVIAVITLAVLGANIGAYALTQTAATEVPEEVSASLVAPTVAATVEVPEDVPELVFGKVIAEECSREDHLGDGVTTESFLVQRRPEGETRTYQLDSPRMEYTLLDVAPADSVVDQMDIAFGEGPLMRLDRIAMQWTNWRYTLNASEGGHPVYDKVEYEPYAEWGDRTMADAYQRMGIEALCRPFD